VDQTNLDIYGHAALAWSRVEQQMDAVVGQDITHFLATVRPDGRPHVAGVGALWVDGKFYFVSGAGTRKSRNLAERPDSVISVKLPELDLVVEGTARKVTDESTLERLAKRYDAQGWPATVEDGAFTAPYNAPSAGPPPWDLYEFTPRPHSPWRRRAARRHPLALLDLSISVAYADGCHPGSHPWITALTDSLPKSIPAQATRGVDTRHPYRPLRPRRASRSSTGGTAMPRFITFFSYSAASATAMIEHPSDRSAAAKALVESLGGSMEAFYWMQGKHDGSHREPS
jgi:hypothetical protein